MKDREEFIERVWQKSEKAFAEEKRRKDRRRKIGSFALAAACLTLIVGVANFDKLYDKLYDTADMAFKEELHIIHSNEELQNNEGIQDYDGTERHNYDSTDSADLAKPEAVEPAEKKSQITGEKSDVKKVVIENMNTADGVTMTGEKEISEYLKWFDGLPEELILTEGEYNKSENKIKVYYKFTIEKGTGEDAEAESETYYITDDVELP